MAQLKWIRHADLAIVKRPSVRREEYLDYMTFQRSRPPLFTEIFGPLVGLKEEWEEQGASSAELDFSAFRYRCEWRGFLPVVTGLLGGQAETVVEETAEFLVTRDALGRTMRMAKGASTLPLPQDYPVREMSDWRRIKPLYQFSPQRLAGDWLAQAEQFRREGRVVCVSIPGGFDEPRQLMGEEALCLAYYEQPDLVQDMLDTFRETALRVLDEVSRQTQVDLLFVHEDMAGKPGPLIGPNQVRRFIAPYYSAVWGLLNGRGARLFDQDSDGNMTAVIPAFLDAGVNLMHPIEPAAGMDPVRLRQRFGARLAMYGGIDKHVLRRSQAEIDAELEYKLPGLLEQGGYMPALDHRVPNGTPLENYRYYIRKVWEILERYR